MNEFALFFMNYEPFLLRYSIIIYVHLYVCLNYNGERERKTRYTRGRARRFRVLTRA